MIIKWLSIKRKIAKVQIVHDYKEDEWNEFFIFRSDEIPNWKIEEYNIIYEPIAYKK
jgi:hypothetical protein